MYINEQELTLPEGRFRTNVIFFEQLDKTRLLEIYNSWRNLSENLNALHARSVNLPEGLSESAFCLAMGTVRTTGKIQGTNSSFDSFCLNRNKRIQIKACSVLPDLTSFGPNSVWDELYFVDFYKDGNWDGTFDIYLIPNELIYGQYVNETQTFIDQQREGRRPRFSIYTKIIQENNLLPIMTGNLNP